MVTGFPFSLSLVFLSRFFRFWPQNFGLRSSDPCISSPWSSIWRSKVANYVVLCLVRISSNKFLSLSDPRMRIFHKLSRISSNTFLRLSDSRTVHLLQAFQNIVQYIFELIRPTYAQLLQAFHNIVQYIFELIRPTYAHLLQAFQNIV